MTGPRVGDPAPEAALLDLAGETVSLSSLWSGGPAVVIFLRYFGCPFCQAQVVALRRDEARFRDAGATVALIGHGHPHEAQRFVRDKRLPFPLMLDPDREAYRAYGLVRGRAMQVLGPRVVLPWLRAETSAETRQRGLKGGSFFQMPGTFVIDGGGIVRLTGGLVRLAYLSRHVADAPSNELILKLVSELPGRDRQQPEARSDGPRQK